MGTGAGSDCGPGGEGPRSAQAPRPPLSASTPPLPRPPSPAGQHRCGTRRWWPLGARRPLDSPARPGPAPEGMRRWTAAGRGGWALLRRRRRRGGLRRSASPQGLTAARRARRAAGTGALLAPAGRRGSRPSPARDGDVRSCREGTGARTPVGAATIT